MRFMFSASSRIDILDTWILLKAFGVACPSDTESKLPQLDMFTRHPHRYDFLFGIARGLSVLARSEVKSGLDRPAIGTR